MSIIHITPDKKWSYINQSILSQCSRQFHDEISPIIITRSKFIKQQFANQGFRTHQLPLMGIADFITTLSISRLIKTGATTLNTYRLSDAGIACQAKLLSENSSNEVYLHVSSLPSQFTKPESDILANIDRFILPSTFALNKFKELAPNISDNRLTVDSNSFTYSKTCDKTSDSFVVLFYDELTRENGLVTAIDAMEKLTDIPVELHIPGTADSTKIMPIVKYARYSLNAKNIKWLGDVDDMGELLAKTSVAVIPAITPMLSNARINDCIACGTYAVTTNNGAQPEALNNSASGTLIDPDNAEALADSIRQYYNLTHKK
jgi:glycosyltransferase involved in cell wall biosynthesis